MSMKVTGPIFGANWKAAMPPAKTREFFSGFSASVPQWSTIINSGARIIIAPPAASITIARELMDRFGYKSTLNLGVQNPWIKSGAYTDATTFEDALDPEVRAEYAIIGHSENRQAWRMISNQICSLTHDKDGQFQSISDIAAAILAEAKLDSEKPQSFRLALDAVVNAQVRKALEVKIIPILCVGETLDERNAGLTMNVVGGQLFTGLAGLSPEQIARVIIAYEPIWAIGTGQTAEPEEAQEVHAEIKKIVGDVPVLYGGSMTPKNVESLLSQPDIDGGLIGGASLKPDVFMDLVLKGINVYKGGR